MKTKLFLLVAMVVMLFSFASIRKDTSKSFKKNDSSSQTEVRNNKGLASEDKDQFN